MNSHGRSPLVAHKSGGARGPPFNPAVLISGSSNGRQEAVAGHTIVLDVLTGSSTEYSDLCLELLVHEGAEKGAAGGTVSVANQGNVSLVV